MLETIRRDWKGVLFQAVAFSITLILLLVLTTLVFPNSEREALEDTRDATRAMVCVLALPVTDEGRKLEQVNECLRENGLEPIIP